MLRNGLHSLATLNNAACIMTRNLAGLMLMCMVLIVMVQIIFRYLLNDSLIWTEEVARTMMVWTAFLVAPWAYRHSAHIRIDLLAEELPTALRHTLTLLLNLMICWILLVFLIESFGFWTRGLSVRADSLPIQVAWFYTIVPIAFSLMLLVSLEIILRNILTMLNPEEDFSIPTFDDVVGGE